MLYIQPIPHSDKLIVKYAILVYEVAHSKPGRQSGKRRRRGDISGKVEWIIVEVNSNAHEEGETCASLSCPDQASGTLQQLGQGKTNDIYFPEMERIDLFARIEEIGL